MLNRFKNWLANKGRVLLPWYRKDFQKKPESERSLNELSDTIRSKLKNAVQNLPNNPADVESILSTLEEAFEQWREDPENEANSVVILSSPVTAVSRILSETLAEWAEQKQVLIKLLPLTARPNTTETIKSELEQYLTPNSSHQKQIEVVVIPNLCWCFLRSLEGLKGIEYLREILCDHTFSLNNEAHPSNKINKNRFWIFGANHVGWDYLNLVFNLEAYCGKIVNLPDIESKKLSEWLEPIIDKFDITFDEPNIDKKLLDQDKDRKTHYFERLTFISEKVSIVATQVFLQSIYYQETQEEEADSQLKVLVAETPKLPKLPDLKPAEQYLLYSLLLHDDLTISALAESLGDEEAQVQGIIQTLSRQGIVEKHYQTFKVNPIHYPRLKDHLKNNNFIINNE